MVIPFYICTVIYNSSLRSCGQYHHGLHSTFSPVDPSLVLVEDAPDPEYPEKDFLAELPSDDSSLLVKRRTRRSGDVFRFMSYLPERRSSSGERKPLDRDGRLRGVEVLIGLEALNSTGVEVNRGLLVRDGWVQSLGNKLW